MKQKIKIPKNWQKLKIKKCLTICHGKSQHEVEDKNGKYPILGSGGIIGFANKYIYNKPSVLIGRKGTIDISRYMDTPFWTVDTLFYSVINEGFSAKFLYYLFNTINWYRYNEASGVPSLSASTIMNIECIVPPIKEQEKIVDILYLWDKAIETTKKLIEQKKLQKKYLMQKLLTVKIRLKGFKDKWKNNQLKTLCSIKKGEQLNSNQLSEQNLYSCLNGGILPSGYTNKWNTEKNTITISEGGNSCGYVNFMKNRFWAGGHCYTLINVGINLEFLYLVLKFKEKQIMLLRVGSGLPNIQKTDLEKMCIKVPTDIAEQKAIADILSTADKQIDLLKQKLSNLELQKKSLMQKLLTGEIRVC